MDTNTISARKRSCGMTFPSNFVNSPVNSPLPSAKRPKLELDQNNNSQAPQSIPKQQQQQQLFPIINSKWPEEFVFQDIRTLQHLNTFDIRTRSVEHWNSKTGLCRQCDMQYGVCDH